MRALRTMLLVVLAVTAAWAADDGARLQKGQALLDDIRAELEQPAEQGTATCSLSEPEVGPHRAHGDRPFDYRRSLTLSNSLVTYNLRYWVNTGGADGSDPQAIEGSSGLGMDRPAAANWYSNNFLEFGYGGKPILKTCLAAFDVLQTGSRVARGAVTWDTPEARVALSVALAADAVHLDTRLQVVVKGEPQQVRVGYRAYPGHYPEPRDRRAATPSRELTAPQAVTLAPEETRIVLFDEHDPTMACALDVSGSAHAEILLDLGTYGVTLTLCYAPAREIDCGPVRLWDFAGVSLNNAINQVFGEE